MTFNYYLAWLHFDAHGRMTTRLPEGHRILNVLHNSGSNRHPPALWVLVEAVMASPAYTPSGGFPVPASEPQPEYRNPPAGDFTYSDSEPQPAGTTRYPELSPEARDADYARGNDNYVPGLPMSPAGRS